MVMKRISILLLLVLLLPFSSYAQEKDSFWRDFNDFLDLRADKAYAKLDSTYIGRYHYHWDARLFYHTAGLHLNTEGLTQSQLATGMSNRAGVGLSYRGIGLNFSVAIGKKMNYDFGFATYGQHLGFEYTLRASSRLSGVVAWPGEAVRRAENGDLTLLASNLNLIYSFNSRFSYAAAMKQTAIQRRSAGSLLVATSWTLWDVLGAGPEILSEQTSIQTFLEVTNLMYNRFSVGAGYGYNWVLGQEHLLLHASVIPMWSFYDVTTRRVKGVSTSYRRPMGRIAASGTARAGIDYRWGDRWSLGLTGIVNQMASSTSFRRGQEGYQRLAAQEWQAMLSLGIRF